MRTEGVVLLAVATAIALAGPAVSQGTRGAAAGGTAAIEGALASGDVEAIRAMGPGVLPRLAQLYASSDEARRAQIASVFYTLKWRSLEATTVLIRDAHTPNANLRIPVQYALGAVSSDLVVVDVLIDNMQNDGNVLFRDKAACALAYDQVHLTPAQKVHLYEGVIRALDDPKPDVRRIAAQVLQIHTGQDKGFRFAGPPEARARAVEAWRQWLVEYRSQN
jgi:HEAT repeat protein